MSGGPITVEIRHRIRIRGPAARRAEARDALAARVYELLSRCRSFATSGLALIEAERVATEADRGDGKPGSGYVDLDAAAAALRARGRAAPRGEAPASFRIDRLVATYTNRPGGGGWRHWLTVEDDEVTREPGGSV